MRKFKFKKEYTYINKMGVEDNYKKGDELNISANGYVCDGCFEVFEENSELAKEYGTIVNRLW